VPEVVYLYVMATAFQIPCVKMRLKSALTAIFNKLATGFPIKLGTAFFSGADLSCLSESLIALILRERVVLIKGIEHE